MLLLQHRMPHVLLLLLRYNWWLFGEDVAQDGQEIDNGGPLEGEDKPSTHGLQQREIP